MSFNCSLMKIKRFQFPFSIHSVPSLTLDFKSLLSSLYCLHYSFPEEVILPLHFGHMFFSRHYPLLHLNQVGNLRNTLLSEYIYNMSTVGFYRFLSIIHFFAFYLFNVMSILILPQFIPKRGPYLSWKENLYHRTNLLYPLTVFMRY